MTDNALAERIRRELRRNARDHCFIHTLELDVIWPDRKARQVHLSRVAEKNGFALACYDEDIGAIFVEPDVRAAVGFIEPDIRAAVGRVHARKPASRRSQQPPTAI